MKLNKMKQTKKISKWKRKRKNNVKLIEDLNYKQKKINKDLIWFCTTIIETFRNISKILVKRVLGMTRATDLLIQLGFPVLKYFETFWKYSPMCAWYNQVTNSANHFETTNEYTDPAWFLSSKIFRNISKI